MFSVVIPVYNRETLIEETLESVRAQTYRPIEIIVVDDGSSDCTRNAIKSWKHANEEEVQLSLTYIYQKNRGAGAARNRGIKEIHGEFIQFFDSDDRLHPERFQRLVKVFQDTGADFIQTGFDGFDPNTGETVEIHYGRLKDDLVSQALMGVLWPNTLRSAFRRDLVEETGCWNTAMTCFEDYEYVIRALIKSAKAVGVRDILASARRGGGERISDRMNTWEGRSCRLECEKLVAQLALQHAHDMPQPAKRKFVERIYHLGVRTFAEGWQDLAFRCGDIVNAIGPVKKDYRCFKWHFMWRLGVVGGRLYRLMKSN